ncbi:uncharacterized protein I206_102406 [Kwoniella pini CBS 10737]|uniref:Uncharacterized protein n=1 Tax=Kwoniella pini CBS 10737 TaxID=1296096 RepID=A0A1B9I5A2_9TREE|nr:uncharacterized protein I206_02753 [Kwoniella pini CBS 10737]OCF50697.1 hypothetical protein I206_02753 [Kwoniella pini CBS 10737]
MTLYLSALPSLSTSSSMSSSGSGPSTPSTPSSHNLNRLDSQALAARIRQLKRSPESPSRLTLPPIMGVFDEDDDEDQDEHEDEEKLSSAFVESLDIPSPGQEGLYKIPEEDEDAMLQQEEDQERFDEAGPFMRESWEIDQEHERHESGSTYSQLNVQGELYNDENLPATNSILSPIDPYSPPPPSPCMTNIPSPTLPCSPAVPGPEWTSSTGQSSEQPGESDTYQTPEQYADAPSDSPIATPYVDPSCVPQRTRRRTLSELEPYRKLAMNKAAVQTHQYAAALEQERQRREYEEREGIWMRYRPRPFRFFGNTRGGWNGPEPMYRAQSFPPASLPPTPSYTEYPDEFANQIDQSTLSWYDDQQGDDGEIRHVEYASSSSSPLSVPVSSDGYTDFEYSQSQEETDEMYSPSSDQLYTPQISDNGARMFFPSTQDIFGRSLEYSTLSTPSLGLSREEQSRFNAGSTQAYGLGLGLTGIDQNHTPDGNGRMSFDQMIRFEEGKEPEEGEISLVEMPIGTIIPERPFEEWQAACREMTRKRREEKDIARYRERLHADESHRMSFDPSHDVDEGVGRSRLSYREDLDELPDLERGRPKFKLSNVNLNGELMRSPESSLTYSQDSLYSNLADGSINTSSSQKGVHCQGDGCPVGSNIESPESNYSEDLHYEEPVIVNHLKRRHSAPGKLGHRITFTSFNSDKTLTSTSGNLKEDLGRTRSKSDPPRPA